MVCRYIRRLALTLIGLLVAAGPAAAQGTAVPAERTFRDWVVGCDNTRACTAVGMVSPDDIDVAFVHVQRVAGGDARPRFGLVVSDDSKGRRMSIAIDGKAIDGVAASRPAAPIPDFDGFLQTTLAEAEIAPFVAALRRGSRLQVGVDGGASAEVSLDGAMAALLFIDDVQGRVDTVTALARRGSRPTSSVPPAPALPLIHGRPAPAGTTVDPRRAKAIGENWARQTAKDCEFEDTGSATEPETMAPLSDGRVLVGVGCGSGAYNFDSVFGIAPPGDPLRVEAVRFALPAVDGSGPGGIGETLTNGYFDPATATLRFFAKGRGFGDCGSSGTYAWTGEAFALAHWRVMPECRGVPEPFWLVIWRSRDR